MRFVVSPEARADLLSIRDHVSEVSLDAAERLVDEFERAFDRVASYPGIGHVRQDLTSAPVRFHAIGNYFVIYKPDAHPLEIVRVIHVRRDVAGLLNLFGTVDLDEEYDYKANRSRRGDNL